MAASPLVDEIVEALRSHPDEFWARREVQRVLDEHMQDAECDMCSGYGYVSDPPAPELTDAEEAELAAARAFAAKARGKANGHLQALIAMVERLTEDDT